MGREVRGEEGNQGERKPRWGGATAQSANRKEERDRQRGLTDLSKVCTCEENRQMGQIKEQRDRHRGRRWQEVRVAKGKAALSVWSSVGPTPHPNPGP